MVRHRPPPARILPIHREIAPATACDFLTIDQVAELLAVDERTVRRWIKRGRLACLAIGRTRRIPVSALSSALSGHDIEMPDNINQSNDLTSSSEDMPV